MLLVGANYSQAAPAQPSAALQVTKTSAKMPSQTQAPSQARSKCDRAAGSQKSPAKRSGNGALLTIAPIQGWCVAPVFIALSKVLVAFRSAFMMYPSS